MVRTRSPTNPLARSARHLIGTRTVLPAALVFLLVIAGGAYALDRVVDWSSLISGDPPTVASPAPPGAQLNRQERDYYDYVAPRLRELAAEASQLERLAARRSRNLFALQRGGESVQRLVDEIDVFERDQGTPPRFAAASASYREGARLVLAAMTETREAFRSFAWDRIASAVGVFGQGAALLAQAVTEMDGTGGSPHPSPSASPAASR